MVGAPIGTSGLIERRMPTTPAICGADIEVPVHQPVPLPKPGPGN